MKQTGYIKQSAMALSLPYYLPNGIAAGEVSAPQYREFRQTLKTIRGY
jgi:hypothetical protein